MNGWTKEKTEDMTTDNMCKETLIERMIFQTCAGMCIRGII